MINRTVFFISDGTGITAGALGKLLEHFPSTSFTQVRMPFTDTLDKIKLAQEAILQAAEVNGGRPVVIMSIGSIELRNAWKESNALLAEQFLAHFDGFSIGSNDLTQLTLGMDRDSGILADGFDERNDAVKVLIKMAIQTCNRLGKYVGICGQGPSDHPDFAEWLLAEGIQSMSLNPDTVVSTWQRLTKK